MPQFPYYPGTNTSQQHVRTQPVFQPHYAGHVFMDTRYQLTPVIDTGRVFTEGMHVYESPHIPAEWMDTAMHITIRT